MKFFLFYALIWRLAVTLNGGTKSDITRTQTFSKAHAAKAVTQKPAARLTETDAINPLFILK